MFFLCWEKNDQRGWEKCHKAKDIADAFVKGDLETADKVFCLYSGCEGMVYAAVERRRHGLVRDYVKRIGGRQTHFLSRSIRASSATPSDAPARITCTLAGTSAGLGSM